MARLDIDVTNIYFRSSRVYIGTTPAIIGTPALSNRKFLTIINFGTANLFVGSSGLTITGYPYYPGQSDTLRIGPSVRIFGITQSGSIDVRYQEGS